MTSSPNQFVGSNTRDNEGKHGRKNSNAVGLVSPSPFSLFGNIEVPQYIVHMSLPQTTQLPCSVKLETKKKSRRQKLSEEFVRSYPFNSPAVRDVEVKGLMLISNTRSKSYAIQGDIWKNKRLVKCIRLTIGRVDRVSLRKARSQARELMAAISRGEDPTATNSGISLTLQEVWALYQKTGNLSPKTVKEYSGHLRRYLKKWLTTPLSELGENRRIVRELHERLTTKHGPYAANHAMRTFRALYNRALREDQTLPPNPTIAVRFNKEKRRNWALSKEELPVWFEKVQKLTPIFRDLHIFLLFTGLRRNDACTASWDAFDESKSTLYIPAPKGGEERAFTLPLSSYLVGLLKSRRDENAILFPNSPWIFPSQSRSGHVEEPKKVGLAQPHALRHTWTTTAIEAGLSYIDTRVMLNHRWSDVTLGYVTRDALIEHLKAQQERMTAFLLKAVNHSGSEVPKPKDEGS